MANIVHRTLDRYPATAPRMGYLGISVLVTVVLYYEFYVQGAVSTQITQSYGMSFNYLVAVVVIANAAGALASFAAGLADRFGRAQLVVFGMLGAGVITTFGLPNAGSKAAYCVLYALLGVVEGVALVATPALIRDFSPQLGRASAMGFWTLGPVLGSLVTTEVSSNTLSHHTDWEFQFRVAGIAGLAVAVLAFVFLRELSPKLRDQLMVSMKDRQLIEARAAGIDTAAAEKGGIREMLRVDVMVPAFAVSVFLLFYYVLVAFFVVYMATVFGYTPARANALANWYWISNAIALVVAGYVSDKFGVRKPFMVLGGVVSATMLAIFTTKSTDLGTGYYEFATIMVIAAAGGGIAYVNWMAAFTETVEKHNPAGTASGLAVWGLIIRGVVAVGFLVMPHVVSAANILVNEGPRAQTLSAQYATQLAVLQKVTPATQAALAKNPNDPAAQAAAAAEVAGNGITAADVAKAQTLSTQYKTQLATLAKLTPATAAALEANPLDPTVQAQAVAEIGNNAFTAADVAKAATIQAQYKSQLATLAVIPQGALIILQSDPTNAGALQTAITAIMTNLHVTQAQAGADLQAVNTVPRDDLTFIFTTGPQIQAAGAQLQAASTVPQAYLGFLQNEGTKIQAAATSLTAANAAIPKADLAFLTTEGPKVQAAQKKNPGEWKDWWWVCFGGQIVFLLCVGMLAGRWSPKKAREDVRAHEEMVQAELAAMAQAGTITMPDAVSVPTPRATDEVDLRGKKAKH